MFGIDTLTIAFLFTCAFLLNRKEDEKKKNSEEKFGEAFKTLLVESIRESRTEGKKDSK
jgi:hypothetical protein